MKKNGIGGGGASSSSSFPSSSNGKPRTALELFSADVAETVSAAAGGAKGAELKELVQEAWDGASASARAPYLSRATTEAAAFAAALAAAGGGGSGGGGNGSVGGVSKKRGRSKKKSEDDEIEEAERYLAEAAELKSKLNNSKKNAPAPDTDDEDEGEREHETDWGAAPPVAILGLTPRRKHLVVARAGAPLFAYGLVSASLAARARDGDAEAMAHCPLPAGMLEEFEEASDAFDRELAARSDGTGGYDLSGIADALCFVGGGEEGKGVPNAATAAPPLDSFAFVGSMRQARAGLLGKPLPLSSSSAKGGGDANAKKGANKKLKQDVMVQVPALALSRLVRRIQVAAAVRLWSWSFLFWKVFSSFADDEERKTRKKTHFFLHFFEFLSPHFSKKTIQQPGRGQDGRRRSCRGREEGRGRRGRVRGCHGGGGSRGEGGSHACGGGDGGRGKGEHCWCSYGPGLESRGRGEVKRALRVALE